MHIYGMWGHRNIKKALALMEISVEWKKQTHPWLWRHRWGKEAATGYAPASWQLLPALLSSSSLTKLLLRLCSSPSSPGKWLNISLPHLELVLACSLGLHADLGTTEDSLLLPGCPGAWGHTLPPSIAPAFHSWLSLWVRRWANRVDVKGRLVGLGYGDHKREVC